MEDYHCSVREVFSDLVKVGENDRCLLCGSASDQAADEDHRRIAGLDRARSPPKSVSAEIRTCPSGALEDRFVGRCLHAEVAHVHGVMPGRL